MQVNEILAEGTELLQKAGVEEYELDARLLLEAVLKKSRTELFLAAREDIGTDDTSSYMTMIRRRATREPVAYMLGEQEFWSLAFTVTPDVLIPRPETEFLLEQVFSLTKPENFEKGCIVDLCCGSGVIAAIIALEKTQTVYAVDLSPQALKVARQNVIRHNLLDRVQLIQGNLLDSFSRKSNCSLIVSNPPYISHTDVLTNLEPEVGKFEPHLALDGGDRGMDLIEIIYRQLEDVLLPGGQFFMEFGADQGEEIAQLFRGDKGASSFFSTVEIIQDYAGRDRVLHAVKSNR